MLPLYAVNNFWNDEPALVNLHTITIALYVLPDILDQCCYIYVTAHLFAISKAEIRENYLFV